MVFDYLKGKAPEIIAEAIERSRLAREQKAKDKQLMLSALRATLVSEDTSAAQKINAAKELGKVVNPKRKKKEKVAKIEHLTGPEIMEMIDRLEVEPALAGVVHRARDGRSTHTIADLNEKFLAEFKMVCECELYYFAKYILNRDIMTRGLHKQMAEFIQDTSKSRYRLMLIPVSHLKTTLGSQAFPIHCLIQPKHRNRYFPGMEGRNTRILLAGEIQGKANSNLAFISEQFKSNKWLRYLWPEVCWHDPLQDAPKWTDSQIQVRRSMDFAEPSIMAVGVDVSVHAYHFDTIIMDDIVTIKSMNSTLQMDKTRNWRKAIRSRFNDPSTAIELGIGTRWGLDDIYEDWLQDPSVQTMVRSAIENGQPIWPERFTLDYLNALRTDKSMGDILFSLQYMNVPVSTSFSALDWNQLREFNWTEGKTQLMFNEVEADSSNANRYTSGTKAKMLALKRGQPLSLAYPTGKRRPISGWSGGIKNESGEYEEGNMFLIKQLYGDEGQRVRRQQARADLFKNK